MSETPNVDPSLAAWLAKPRRDGTDLLVLIAEIETDGERVPDATTIGVALALSRQKVQPLLVEFVRAGCLREVVHPKRPTRYRLTPEGREAMAAALSCRKPFRPLREAISDPILSTLLCRSI